MPEVAPVMKDLITELFKCYRHEKTVLSRVVTPKSEASLIISDYLSDGRRSSSAIRSCTPPLMPVPVGMPSYRLQWNGSLPHRPGCDEMSMRLRDMKRVGVAMAQIMDLLFKARVFDRLLKVRER